MDWVELVLVLVLVLVLLLLLLQEALVDRVVQVALFVQVLADELGERSLLAGRRRGCRAGAARLLAHLAHLLVGLLRGWLSLLLVELLVVLVHERVWPE